MEESKRKKTRAVRRAKRVRSRMLGVAEKPRLSVFRSHKHIRAQLIDDVAGRVISSASSLEKLGDATKVSQEKPEDAAKVAQEKPGDAAQVSKEGKKSGKKSGSTRKFSKGVQVAYLVGTAIAKKAKEAGIKACVFDRGCYRYHGRVKALADGARKEGLRF